MEQVRRSPRKKSVKAATKIIEPAGTFAKPTFQVVSDETIVRQEGVPQTLAARANPRLVSGVVLVVLAALIAGILLPGLIQQVDKVAAAFVVGVIIAIGLMVKGARMVLATFH